MSIFLPANIATFASTRETSSEIAYAIFEIAAEGDEGRMWADPTKDEIEMVTRRAWSLADADETILHWGHQACYRPSAPRA